MSEAAPTIEVAGQYLHLPYNSRLVSRSAQVPLIKQPATTAAVFLDRDGVVVEDVHFLTKSADLRLMPGAVRGIRKLQERFHIIVVTNQSGVARGLLTEEDLLAIHSDMVRGLAAREAVVDAIYYCPHLPEAPNPAYRMECDCRKPRPGMLLRAKGDWGVDMPSSFLIGDSPRDMAAGSAGGVKSILLAQSGESLSEGQLSAADLNEAADLIMSQTREPLTCTGGHGGRKAARGLR